MSPAPEPMYWTAGDVGALFQASDKTIYRLAKKDPTFPMIKVAGMVRFPRERVLKWLRDHEQGQATPRRTKAPPAAAAG